MATTEFDNGGIWEDSGSNSSSCSNFLTRVDCSAIEEMDPSLAEGHVLLYCREVPCELRLQDGTSSKDMGRLEPIRAKVLILGDEQHLQEVRVELTNENDLFLNYTHSVDEETFQQMQQNQKLLAEFSDYPNVLIRMLNACIREPHSFLAVFIMQTNGKARLDFIQNMEYKLVELLSCQFKQSSEEFTRKDMSFRYNAIKSKMALLQARLHDIGCLLRLKSPSLLLQLQKAAQQQAQRRQQQQIPATSKTGRRTISSPVVKLP